MPWGKGNTFDALTTVYSAKARPLEMAITRSPSRHPTTSSPIASTMPATSAPGMNGNGGFTWYFPCTCKTSKKFKAAVRLRMRTSSGPAAGTSTCSNTIDSGSPQACTCHAFNLDPRLRHEFGHQIRIDRFRTTF